MQERFRIFASKIAAVIGSPYAFCIALALVILWAIAGPLFDYSTTWQLLINTGTTICTFLIVFLIQYVQNRDTKALHLKLDEVIRALETARNDLINIENKPDKAIQERQAEFEQVAE